MFAYTPRQTMTWGKREILSKDTRKWKNYFVDQKTMKRRWKYNKVCKKTLLAICVIITYVAYCNFLLTACCVNVTEESLTMIHVTWIIGAALFALVFLYLWDKLFG